MQTTDKSPANGTSQRLLCAALTALSLLAAAWSAPGHAAAHLDVGCDRVAKDFETLDSGSLEIQVVDLSDVSDSSPGDTDDLTKSVAPFLFLTPRVTSILQDVFGDSGKPAAAPETKAAVAEEAQATAPSASPVVDNASTSEFTGPVSPLYENGAILPRFQRQMYRTDI